MNAFFKIVTLVAVLLLQAACTSMEEVRDDFGQAFAPASCEVRGKNMTKRLRELDPGAAKVKTLAGCQWML